MRSPLSLEAFADWCEKQPANETYNFWSTYTPGCAVIQYLRTLGLGRSDYPRFSSTTGAGEYAGNGTQTFGALAHRLRLALAQGGES